jgi:hypothetical protein
MNQPTTQTLLTKPGDLRCCSGRDEGDGRRRGVLLIIPTAARGVVAIPLDRRAGRACLAMTQALEGEAVLEEVAISVRSIVCDGLDMSMKSSGNRRERIRPTFHDTSVRFLT